MNHALDGALSRARSLALFLVAAFMLAGTLVIVGGASAPADAASARVLKQRGEKIVAVARNQAGDPYRYGATGPNAFDCSGLTQYVYRKATGKSLPRTSDAQARAAKRIKRSSARRGDLVFFHNGGNVYHTAIYAGRNKVWHSPGSGQRVHKAKIWSGSVFFGRVR